jgi:hypothetical protein
LVTDKWSHIPWVRGEPLWHVHGSGVFSTHQIQEVSMPFGTEEGLSKPATRRIFPERPKAETASTQAKHGTFGGQSFGQKADLTKVFAESGPNVEKRLQSH